MPAKTKPTRQDLGSRHGAIQVESKPRPEGSRLLAEYKALRYDYGQVSARYRQAVQDATVDINRKSRRAHEDLLAIGRRLIEVKEMLPYGQFLDWLEAEFEQSDRMARRQMEVANAFADSELWTRVSKLSDGAIYLLAAPSTPQSAREAVARLIDKSEKVPRVHVQQVIEEEQRRLLPAAPPPPASSTRMIEMNSETPALVERKLSNVELLNRDLERYHAEARAVYLQPANAEPQVDIDAEYTVVAPPLSPLTFAEWWAMMPKEEMSLANWLLIFQTAKVGAANAGTLEPRLKLAVTNVMVTWSKFVNAVEKELKNE